MQTMKERVSFQKQSEVGTRAKMKNRYFYFFTRFRYNTCYLHTFHIIYKYQCYEYRYRIFNKYIKALYILVDKTFDKIKNCLFFPVEIATSYNFTPVFVRRSESMFVFDSLLLPSSHRRKF